MAGQSSAIPICVPIAGGRNQEAAMTAIAQALSRVLVIVNDNVVLKELVIFSGAGLLVSLLLMTHGLDLSPGF
jgi:hypothetical protein